MWRWCWVARALFPSPPAYSKVAIRAAHEKTRRTYGAKRLHKELQDEGFVTGRVRSRAKSVCEVVFKPLMVHLPFSARAFRKLMIRTSLSRSACAKESTASTSSHQQIKWTAWGLLRDGNRIRSHELPDVHFVYFSLPYACRSLGSDHDAGFSNNRKWSMPTGSSVCMGTRATRLA